MINYEDTTQVFYKDKDGKNIRIRHQLIGDDQKSINRSSHLLNGLKEAIPVAVCRVTSDISILYTCILFLLKNIIYAYIHIPLSNELFVCVNDLQDKPNRFLRQLL